MKMKKQTPKMLYIAITAAGICLLQARSVEAQVATAIDIALIACTDPAPELSARLYALAAAGWRTVDDTQSVRDLSELLKMSRFPAQFNGDLQEDILNFNKHRAEPRILSLPPNVPLTADSLISWRGAELSVDGLDATLTVQFILGEDESTARFRCLIVAASPVDSAKVQKLLLTYEGGKVVVATADWPLPDTFSLMGKADAYRIRVTHTDFTSVPGLNDIARAAGSDVEISTSIETNLFPMKVK